MRERRVAFVHSGEDRFGEHRTVGLSSTDFKVSTQDGSGGLFIMQHRNRKRGGPPRHLHHNEDEWFFAIEGEYLVEVGKERFQLRSGDSVLAPREVPHAWAFVGNTQGKLLIAFVPATNKIEEWFRNRKAAVAIATRRRIIGRTVWSWLGRSSPSNKRFSKSET